jgi:hypothetical protein
VTKLLVLALVAAAIGDHSEPGASPTASVAECVQYWPEARFAALGYNHMVHVRDMCDVPAGCSVTTDVNPQPHPVTVPPRSEIEVMTFRGSPARVFTPKVDCRMGAPPPQPPPQPQ